MRKFQWNLCTPSVKGNNYWWVLKRQTKTPLSARIFNQAGSSSRKWDSWLQLYIETSTINDTEPQLPICYDEGVLSIVFYLFTVSLVMNLWLLFFSFSCGRVTLIGIRCALNYIDPLTACDMRIIMKTTFHRIGFVSCFFFQSHAVRIR